MNHTLRLIALGLIGLTATGCTMPLGNGPDQRLSAVDQAFPITVEPQVATLVVRVDDGMQGLARGEDERVRVFVERWKLRGTGLINAAAPTGTPNQAAASAAVEDLKQVFGSSGLNTSAVQFTSYKPASDDAHAPITLSFVTYAAVATECGQDWSKNLAYTPRNLPWPEFGCSTQHNLAAIVSDPRDLMEPRASDPVDGARRSTVLEKYRKGETTATKDTKADSGQVANVGQ